MTNETENLDISEARKLAALNHAYGETIRNALERDDVTEVYINEDGFVWTDGLAGRQQTDTRISPVRAENIISMVADHMRRDVTGDNTTLPAILPTGQRFHGVLPPTSRAPVFNIRQPPRRIFSLAEYVESGRMTSGQADMIRDAVNNRRNILVIGGTGTGKTTLLNGILSEPGFAEDRLVVLQDVPELRCSAKDRLFLYTEPKTMLQLVSETLRLRPDRIIVGETRGIEAWAMVQAWNTGHEGGASTLHANNPAHAFRRLANLIRANGIEPQPDELLDTIHLIVWIARDVSLGRVVREVAEPNGYDKATGRYLTKTVT